MSSANELSISNEKVMSQTLLYLFLVTRLFHLIPCDHICLRNSYDIRTKKNNQFCCFIQVIRLKNTKLHWIVLFFCIWIEPRFVCAPSLHFYMLTIAITSSDCVVLRPIFVVEHASDDCAPGIQYRHDHFCTNAPWLDT